MKDLNVPYIHVAKKPCCGSADSVLKRQTRVRSRRTGIGAKYMGFYFRHVTGYITSPKPTIAEVFSGFP